MKPIQVTVITVEADELAYHSEGYAAAYADLRQAEAVARNSEAEVVAARRTSAPSRELLAALSAALDAKKAAEDKVERKYQRLATFVTRTAEFNAQGALNADARFRLEEAKFARAEAGTDTAGIVAFREAA